MRFPSNQPNRRRVLALGGAACLAAMAPAYARGAAPLTGIEASALGTTWRVSLPSGVETAPLERRLAGLLARIDRVFSPWRADSVLARFNAGAADEAAVPDELVDVARAALSIARDSDGRFDPTMGPLVARWGFGPIREGEARAGGWHGLRAQDGHLLRLRHGLTLDLCGIAKGHALDVMVAALLEAGQRDFVVDLGGELAARGRHPSGRAWQVGIEDPRAGAAGFAGVLRLEDAAVATSGDRANGYDLDGRRYSHIIDPATGEPVASALASVSVLMPTAREADGWATALMAAGAGGPTLARSRGIAALFLLREGDGLRRVATGGFDRHLG